MSMIKNKSVGSARSRAAKMNILASFFFKGLELVAALALIPLSIRMLGEEAFGLWLTMYSFVMWMSVLDVGVGHGLRNKFAESVADGDYTLARQYLGASYIYISKLILSIGIVTLVISYFIDWVSVLNVSANYRVDANFIAVHLIAYFVGSNILGLIIKVALADQKPAIRDAILAATKLLLLGVVYVLWATGSTSLTEYAIAQIYIPMAVLVVASVALFRTYFKNYIPIFAGSTAHLGREVASLGGKFFIVQVAAIILFQTDNIIISRVLGPEEVVGYQVVSRYFSIFLMLFTIIISPLWSGMTDAYRRLDRAWVLSTIRKLMFAHVFLMIIVAIAFIFSPIVINYWIGKRIVADYYLPFGWACFVILQTWNLIFTHFLNGVGEVRMQIITALISIAINIPLSVYFATTLNMGSAGVIHATNISIFMYAATRYWRYRKFMREDWYVDASVEKEARA